MSGVRTDRPRWLEAAQQGDVDRSGKSCGSRYSKLAVLAAGRQAADADVESSGGRLRVPSVDGEQARMPVPPEMIWPALKTSALIVPDPVRAPPSMVTSRH